MNRALRTFLLLALSSFLAMPLFSQSSHAKLRLVQQLGSPISVDEAELSNDNVLTFARVTNESDRKVKTMTLGCVAVSINGDVHSKMGALNAVGYLLPGTSAELHRQTIGCELTSGVKSVVVVFVARVTYENGDEYVADIPAIERELARMSNLRKSG